MNHLNNADASAKLPMNFFCYFHTQLEYSKPFLSSDGEIGLILVEADVDYFLFFLIHSSIYIIQVLSYFAYIYSQMHIILKIVPQ